MSKNNRSIGIFDSGIGGLTVLQALYARNPYDSYVYIGDTARLPYGTKSRETVIKYSLGLTRALLAQNVKAIVIACNTASTHAYDSVCDMAGDIPVISVIDATAAAALKATRNNHIGVIATVGTVASGIYKTKIKSANPNMRVSQQACQMLVALGEEGWHDNSIARAVLYEYLDGMFGREDKPDTLILGCTHFPVFEKLLRELLGPDVTLINSGTETAKSLQDLALTPASEPALQFYATDDIHRFARNAQLFFGEPIPEKNVSLIEIQF